VKAIVLVGGEGTRLRPLTCTTPKQLLPVAEVAMLERVLSQLAIHGVDDAVLSLGYRPDAFLAAYPDGIAAGVRLSYAVEPEPLDTAGAVRFAAAEAGVEQTFVVLNGDVLTDADISALVAFHRRNDAAATIHLTPVEDPSRFGVVPTDSEGRVVTFIEKPPPGEAPTNLINAGIYVLEPEVLERIPQGRRASIERETFPALAADGLLYALASDAYWLDTGTPDAYLRANFDLLDGTRGSLPAPGAHTLADQVWGLGAPEVQGEVGPCSLVGDRARVAAGSVVLKSVVGAGCTVETSAVVDGSVLLPGARIGAGARVTGSIVGHRANVGERCELRSLTVVGDGETLSPGTRLADARVPAEATS
jgi:NDP-sugar pyrophosphorylase family protein